VAARADDSLVTARLAVGIGRRYVAGAIMVRERTYIEEGGESNEKSYEARQMGWPSWEPSSGNIARGHPENKELAKTEEGLACVFSSLETSRDTRSP
jgi:hypothetical protein